MTSRQGDLLEKSDALYEAFIEPLEAEHWGEYVAVSELGEYVLGSSLLKVAIEAEKVLGRGVFVFKVGERAVGRWRSPRRPVPAV